MVLVGEDLYPQWRINYRCNLYASFTTALSMKFVEREFIFDLSIPGETNVDTAVYLDLMQVHSLVNRVGTRQGRLVGVQSIEVGVQRGGNATVAVWRLPHTWACVNAWEKTMRLWKRQQDEAVDDAGLESTVARYRDFKVFMNDQHSDIGFSSNLLPAGFATANGADPVSAYEWIDSRVVLPNEGGIPGDTEERSLMMVGADNGFTNGMIVAYAESRSRPQSVDPNIVDVDTGGLFGEMFDVGMDDTQIIENVQGDNNEPPYLISQGTGLEYYPGGAFQGSQLSTITGPSQTTYGGGFGGLQLHDILSVNANTTRNTDIAGPCLAPCGLLCFQLKAADVGAASGALSPPNGDVNAPFWMKVTLAAGDYQGVFAPDMSEVN